MAVLVATGLTALSVAAQTPAPFTEEAVDRGVAHVFSGITGHQTFGRGVALVDLDGDRDADLVALAGVGGLVGVHENLGDGTFASRTEWSGIPPLPDASSVTAADYDGDGDLDLYIGQWLAPNLLLRNDGGFLFTDVTAAAGTGDAGAAAGCAWADFSGDGRLDLYLANRTLTEGSTVANRLYRNHGDGTFTDVAEAMGVDDDQSPTYQAIFFDMDLDGDQDLYLSTDKGYALGEQNRLFENLGGSFTDVTQSSHAGVSIDSMGVAVGDLDGNGWPDLYCTNTPPGNVLLLNQGDAEFVDATPASATGSFATGWGTEMLDYDGDGWLELYVCNLGYAGDNRLYDHDGSWPATDIAPALAVDDGFPSYAMAVADIDGDGDLDMLVQDADRLRLFVNHEGERRQWIRLHVEAPPPNRFGIGTTVALRVGDAWQSRAVAAGGSYKSQSEATLHFGLGEATVVDEISLAFPDGARRTLTGYPGGVTWTALHPDLLLDGDRDGDVDLDDVRAFADCMGAVSPACVAMDANGNGTVDVDGDGPALLAAYGGLSHDCDDSGAEDMLEILDGVLDDANANWIPDLCEAGGDVDGDGDVDVDDLLLVILAWGACPAEAACVGDADASGNVDVDDLLIIILGWTG
jgi:hypothetical protein